MLPREVFKPGIPKIAFPAIWEECPVIVNWLQSMFGYVTWTLYSTYSLLNRFIKTYTKPMSWRLYRLIYFNYTSCSFGPVTLWRQLFCCDWSWYSHRSFIPGKIDLKIYRSMKSPWQECCGAACSYTLLYSPLRISRLTFISSHNANPPCFPYSTCNDFPGFTINRFKEFAFPIRTAVPSAYSRTGLITD